MIQVCKLCRLLVPWVMILLIRVPSSPSSLITMSLTSTVIPSSAPIRITLTFGISIPVISVMIIGVISIPLSSLPLKRIILTSTCYTESPLVTDHSRLLDLDDCTSYQSSLRFHSHRNFYCVHVLICAVPQYSLFPLYLVGLVCLSGPADADYFSVVTTSLL